jgi:hypothetical protein
MCMEEHKSGNPETSSWIRVRVRLRVIYIPAFPNVPVISEQLRFMFTSSQLQTRVITFIKVWRLKHSNVNLLYYKSFL